MALPWVRLDSSIASHDKILHLLSDSSPKKWQAVASYMFAIGWSGASETDGHIPIAALPFIHGTTTTARLLEKYGLWKENGAGWIIHNFKEYQQTARVAESKRAELSAAARKANCVRWHGPECGCWEKTP